MSKEEYQQIIQEPIAKKVCTALKYWIEKCSNDFNERLHSQLNSFIDNCLSRDGYHQLASSLRASISKNVINQVGTLKQAFLVPNIVCTVDSRAEWLSSCLIL